ncbi:hypothetical protein A0H81_10339 [Grifola frondosa]|uniref:Uncharacterized protein n=1 Tax=Grifola frondosa TaxID=5627 RepID=A0A1C7LYX6_GRIFR|nr:hypothetical protein A0H81_10339 [Grifola frondosa]
MLLTKSEAMNSACHNAIISKFTSYLDRYMLKEMTLHDGNGSLDPQQGARTHLSATTLKEALSGGQQMGYRQFWD